MKTTIRVFCTLCMLVLCVSLSAQEKKVPQEMFGKWNCSIENPQTGDIMKGTCVVDEKDNVVKATFDMGWGEASSSAFRPNDNGKFYADFDVQDFTLGLCFFMKADKLVCEMDAGGYLIPLEMTKE